MDIEKLNRANELNRNINQLSRKLEDFINMLIDAKKLYLTDGCGKMMEIPEEAAYEVKRAFRQSIEIPLNQYTKEFEEL